MTVDAHSRQHSNPLVWKSFLEWAASSKPAARAAVEYEANKVLDSIVLTQQQVDIVRSQSRHLVIRGAAGSGKSLALLSRMIGRMIEEESGRYLYVSYNNKLVQDIRRRFRRSPYHSLVEERHVQKDCAHFNTFHYLVKKVLDQVNVRVPEFVTTPEGLERSSGLIFRQIQRLLRALDTEEFKDMPPIHRIKEEQNAEFLRDEFLWMKANNYITEERYLKCERVGRGNLPGISREQRRTIFKLFQKYCEEQKTIYHGRFDAEDYALKLIECIDLIPESLKYDHIFIDEAQDFQPMQLYALTLLSRGTLTICGDDKQRIYKSSPYSYRRLGIDIDRGSSHLLEGVFRSTEQIMALANALTFTREEDDTSEKEEYAKHGAKPRICSFPSNMKQVDFIIREIKKIKQNHPEETVAVIHRLRDPLKERDLKNALGRHFSLRNADEQREEGSGNQVYVTDAHPIKGLEFDHVYILNFDKKTYPHRSEIAALEKYNTDDVLTKQYREDKRQIVDREKRVLYVALTRARQTVTLTYCGDHFADVSPFISDFNAKDYIRKSY